jgi:uncharacterized protein YjbI with pentapeptide repeats
MLKFCRERHQIIYPAYYGWQGKWYCSFAVMRLVDLQNTQICYEEKDFWLLIMQSLNLVNGEIFEAGIPKPQAEFLAVGACHAPRGTTLEKSFTRISLADKQKTLAVYGNRIWHELGITAVMSKPKLFTRIPLTNRTAFGGKGYELNKEGRGTQIIEPENDPKQIKASIHQPAGYPDFPQDMKTVVDDSMLEMYTYPLPNVEYPDHLVLSKGDRPPYATYYPISPQQSVRLKKLGRSDMNAIKAGAAYQYPNDLDWTYFNQAALDQRFDHYLRGDEDFVIENMHPDHPQIKGQLPGLRMRAFAQFKEVNGVKPYQEIPLNFDTVWFFPEALRGVLVWHGVIEVSDLLASDLTMLQIEEESLNDAVQSIDYYHEKLLAKLAKKDLATRKTEFDKKKAEAIDSIQSKPDAASMTGQTFLNSYFTPEQQQEFKEEMAKMEASVRTDVEKHLEKKLELTEPQMLEHPTDALLKQLQETFAKGGLSYDPTIPLSSNMQHLIQQKDKFKEHILATVPKDATVKAGAVAQKPVEESLDDKLAAAQEKLSKLNPNLPQELLKRKGTSNRTKIEERYARGEELIGLTLTHMDLTGINLQKANLKNASFYYCDLSRADLSGADLTQSQFIQCTLSQTQLSQSILFKSIFHESILTKSLFMNADLEGVIFSTVHAQGANFSQAILYKSIFTDSDMTAANFRNADANEMIMNAVILQETNWCDISARAAVLKDLKIIGVPLAGADLSNAVMENVQLEDLAWINVKMERAKFLNCQLQRITIADCNMTRVMMHKSTLRQWVMRNTMANRLRLMESVIENIKFYDCSLLKCAIAVNTYAIGLEFEYCIITKGRFFTANFSKMRFYRCNMLNLSFHESQVVKSEFLYCDLQQVNFLQADLTESRFIGCNLKSGRLRQTNLAAVQLRFSNLYAVDFYHARIKNTVMDQCLLQDPLPPHFESSFIHG